MARQPGEIYLELHVEYYQDDAVAGVGPESEVLFIRGLCLSRRLLTDGRLGLAQVRRAASDLTDLDAAAARLVEVGLWRKMRGGWRITNFLKRNPSRAQVHAKSLERARAGAKGNHNKWHADKPSSDCEWCEWSKKPRTNRAHATAIANGSQQRSLMDRTTEGLAIATQRSRQRHKTETVLGSSNQGVLTAREDRLSRLLTRTPTPNQARALDDWIAELGEAPVIAVLDRLLIDPPAANAYGVLTTALRAAKAAARPRANGKADYGGAVPPTTSYDALIVTDEEEVDFGSGPEEAARG